MCLQADGGTRTASISGAFVALCLALMKLQAEGIISKLPIIDYVAATSVGIVDGEVVLDLEYIEDSRADVDMNVVMTGKGDFVEVQGTAEGTPFSRAKLGRIVDTWVKKGSGRYLLYRRILLEKGINNDSEFIDSN